MVTAKVAPQHRLALAQAASRHAAAVHAPGHATHWLAVIGLAAACIAVYRVSLWLHPFTTVPPLRRQRHHRRLPSLVTGVLPQMRRPRAGPQARHDDGRPAGTVPAVTAGPGDPGPAAGDHAAARGAARAGLAAGTAAGQPGRLLGRAGGWAGIRTAWCGRGPRSRVPHPEQDPARTPPPSPGNWPGAVRLSRAPRCHLPRRPAPGTPAWLAGRRMTAAGHARSRRAGRPRPRARAGRAGAGCGRWRACCCWWWCARWCSPRAGCGPGAGSRSWRWPGRWRRGR